MKAFLSHSSKDKELVRFVAKELGRQFCIFDEQSFDSGVEFKKSIDEKMDESSLFVLFVSKEALKSIWVEYEQDEAWNRKIMNIISAGLVYIIQSGIDYSEIPEWLRRGPIKHEHVPSVIAREIRYRLDEMQKKRQYPFFVNRTGEIQDIEYKLLPTDGSPTPRAFFVVGLPGIGRRTLIRNISPRILSLVRIVELRVENGDSINDICIKTASLIEPYSTKDGLKTIIDDINTIPEQGATKRCIENIRSITLSGELLIMVDAGGMIDDDGFLTEPVRNIISGLNSLDDTYIAMVANRIPSLPENINCPITKVSPLQPVDVGHLIFLYTRKIGLELNVTHISELTEYVAGYPPAAAYAVQLVHDYGIDAVMEDKRKLVEFRTIVFVKHLAKLRLSDEQKALLCILANFSPLPFSAMGEIIGYHGHNLVKCIIGLIDLALVSVTSDNLYAIADPVAGAIMKEFGFPSKEQAEMVAKRLLKILDVQEWGRPQLDLSRVVFMAARYCGKNELANDVIHLASDLIRLTENFYRQRKYSMAEESARAALIERRKNKAAMSYLISALIQQEKWVEADKEINNFAVFGPIRDVHYLKGFLARKKGDIKNAINEYKQAEKHGRKGAAIKRELALSHLLIGDLNEAKRFIQEALEKHGDNSYLWDLQIQISTRQKDEAAARKGLSKFEAIDKSVFYYHRLSVVELAFGRPNEALEAAKKAVEIEDIPPFEALFQLAICEIQVGNLNEASSLLNRLDKSFSTIRLDLRVTLRCRYEIAKGDYSASLNRTDQINDKNSIFYKTVRRDALNGVLENDALEDSTRKKYQREMDGLNKEISELETWFYWGGDFDG